MATMSNKLASANNKSNANMEDLFGIKMGESVVSTLRLVELSQVQTGSQTRQTFPAKELEELADSIRTLRDKGQGVQRTGILQPLIVTITPENGIYRLIAGERRLRAAALAGVERVPVVVTNTPTEERLLLQVIENLQRQDLPPLEEARGLQLLMEEQKLSVRETAKLLGKDKSYLENRLRLLKMGIDVQEMVSFRKDTLPHARLIDQVVDQKSRSELIQATKEGAGRREIEQAINETKNAVAIVEAGDPNLLVEVDDELPAGLDVQLEPTTEAEAEKNTVTTVETQQSSDSDENTVSFRKDSQTEPLRTSDAEDEGVSATLHLLDEAARRLEGLHLTSEERERVLAALAAMEKSVANRE